MTRLGRPPSGARLAEALPASPEAKARLKAILGTITGELTIAEAAKSIGSNRAYFNKIRSRTLKEAAVGLEARPVGRRPEARDPRDAEIARLRAELQKLRLQLSAAETRTELALAGLGGAVSKKGRPTTKPS